jgi:hypothetical protein
MLLNCGHILIKYRVVPKCYSFSQDKKSIAWNNIAPSSSIPSPVSKQTSTGKTPFLDGTELVKKSIFGLHMRRKRHMRHEQEKSQVQNEA